MKKKILVSAAGTAAAWNIVNTINKNFRDDFEIFACDINPDYLIPSSSFVKGFFQVPSINEENYYKTIMDILEKNKIDIFIPLIDFDLEIFPADNADLISLEVLSTAPLRKFASMAVDKRKMFSYMRDSGLPVPYEFTSKEMENEKKYFVKPNKGFGSQGIRVMEGKEAKNIDFSQWIAQEICISPEVTVEVFRDGNFISTICRERIQVKAGVCTKARIFHDEELHELILKISKNIELPVASCIQVMKSQNNAWRITDINLRLGAGTALSSKVGWDLTSASLINWGNLNFNSKAFLKEIDSEKYVVRVFEEIITK